MFCWPPKAVCHRSYDRIQIWGAWIGPVGLGDGMTSVSPLPNSRPAIGWTPSAAQQAIVDRGRAHAQRAIPGTQVDLACRVSTNNSERLIELDELEVLGRRHPELIEAKPWELRGEVHQLLGLLVAERAEDHAVDDREDRRIRADPEPKGQNRDHCESRRAKQAADGEADVLAQVVEGHRAFDVLERRGVDVLNGVPLRATDQSRPRSERQTDRVRILQTPHARRAGPTRSADRESVLCLASGCCDLHRRAATVQARRLSSTGLGSNPWGPRNDGICRYPSSAVAKPCSDERGCRSSRRPPTRLARRARP